MNELERSALLSLCDQNPRPLAHPERRIGQRRGLVQGDVLLLSQRRIADLAAYCLAYEFEDTFAAVTDAQRIDVTDLPALEFSRRAYKLARLASGSPAACAPARALPAQQSGLGV